MESYSGYKANERPTRLKLGEQTLEVEEVEDGWYAPGETYFRVRVKGGDRYVLRHVEAQDVWGMEGYTSETVRSVKRR
ncbi:MAG: hypothetical protein WBQ59_05180 [Candidatus Acidiferrum sp.]